MLRNVIKLIINAKRIKTLVIYFCSPILYAIYWVLYKILIRNFKDIKPPIGNLKIGIAAYPHIQKGNSYKGGDSTVNSLLKKIFEEQGYQVEYIDYDVDSLKNKNLLKNLLAKLIGMPYIFSENLNYIGKKYNILLVDSGINFHVNHSACINLFHYSFGGYRKLVGSDWGTISHLRYIKLNIIQKFGSIESINIAVSGFLENILAHNNISVNYVIHNSVDTNIFKPVEVEIKRDYLYAGGFSYYGKGFDLLEKLAEKGIEIDCVTNHQDDKSRLKYLPIMSHEDMPAVYNNYKLLFYPSRFESFGLVPVEAMSCGIPVIISEVGIGSILKQYIPEFVVSGYDDIAVNDYLYKADLILNNYDYYSKKAREFVINNFSYDRFKDEWCELIEAIKHNIHQGSKFAEITEENN